MVPVSRAASSGVQEGTVATGVDRIKQLKKLIHSMKGVFLTDRGVVQHIGQRTNNVQPNKPKREGKEEKGESWSTMPDRNHVPGGQIKHAYARC